MGIRDVGRQARETLAEEAKGAGAEAIRAIERDAERRREQACAEVRKFESRLERLRQMKADKAAGRLKRAPLVGLRIAIAKWRLGLAKDNCARLEGEG